MVGDLLRRVNELRFLEGIEKVEHVPYPNGDEFWVRFNRPFDFTKLADVVKRNNCRLVRFANLPSKLPRGLKEILWNGVTYLIVKNISSWSKFISSFGFEPEAIAKIAVDLHGPYHVFIATNEEGVKVLYDYIGLKYVPASPPAKPTPIVAKASPAMQSKPTIPATKPAPVAVQAQATSISPTTASTLTPTSTAKPTVVSVPAQPLAPQPAAQTGTNANTQQSSASKPAAQNPEKKVTTGESGS
jgi:hypothetical protein